MTETDNLNRFAKAETEDEVLGMMVGAGSTCWVGGTGDIEFDSTQAVQVIEQGKARISEIRSENLSRALEESALSWTAIEAATKQTHENERRQFGLRKYLLFGPRRWLGGGFTAAGRTFYWGTHCNKTSTFSWGTHCNKTSHGQRWRWWIR